MLDRDDIRLLDGLAIGAAPSAVAAAAGGRRRSRLRGGGLEFQEYRRYQPGDDLRWIDWTIEARLEQLVVRVPRADGHCSVHLLVDVSASMGVGMPTKLSCATRIAAALGYVAIERRDAVAATLFSDRVVRHLPLGSGRVQLWRTLSTLGAAQPMGVSAIDRAVMQYGALANGPGLVVIVSDFFEPGSRCEALRFLLHRGLTPAIVQVLAPGEIDPALDDSTEIVDVEHPASAPMVVDPSAVRSYLTAIEDQQRELRTFCAEQQVPYLAIGSDSSLAGMLPALRAAGLVETRG